MAKKFFYVCAGLFLLALSYHLGASSATAQGGTVVEGAALQLVPGTPEGNRASACVNRIWRWMRPGGVPQEFPVPVPGTSRIVATDAWQNVLLENGDWYLYSGSGWVYQGSIAGGAPTPAQRATFGQVKARYAPSPVSPTTLTNDR